MNEELNKKIDVPNGKEMPEAEMEKVSGGAGQNIITCPSCGKRFAITHHPTCPYCGNRPVISY